MFTFASFILQNSNYCIWDSVILSVVSSSSELVVMVESGILTIIEHGSVRVSAESGKSGKVREFEIWSGNITENQKVSWMSGKSQGILLVHVIKRKWLFLEIVTCPQNILINNKLSREKINGKENILSRLLTYWSSI